MTDWLSSGDASQHCKRKRNPVSHKCVVLGVASFVFGICGAFLLIHIMSKGYHGKLNEEISLERALKLGHRSSEQCPPTCSSAACMKTAALMMDMMNPAIDPCEDFYNFACHGYNKIPVGNELKKLFIIDIAVEIPKVFRNMLQKMPKSMPKNIPGFFQTKLRKFYDSCMDIKSAEENAIPVALKYLEYFGIKNWPNLSDGYAFEDIELEESVIRLSKYSMFPFYIFDAYHEIQRSRLLNETLINVPEDAVLVKIQKRNSAFFYFDGEITERTKTLLHRTLKHFDLSESTENRILEDVLSFDMEFNNLTEKNKRNSTYSGYFYECAHGEKHIMEKWCGIVRNHLNAFSFFQMYPNVHIIIEDPEHFIELDALISRTSQRTIAHTLALSFFEDNIITMNYAMRKQMRAEDKHVDKYLEVFEDRSLFCAAWVCRKLPRFAGTAFFSSMYEGELHSEAKEIFLDIKKSLISIVKDISWMDSEAKGELEKVLSSVTISAEDYLEYYRNVSAADELARELQITANSFLGNDLEAKKLFMESALPYLGNLNMSNMEVLHLYPFEFDPGFGDNYIDFNFGTFVFPMITVGRPRYLNLGIFGSILGHEFSHALESFLDSYENKSESFKDAYEQRKKCLVDHYSEYEIDIIKEKVKGNQTFGENLSDYFGFLAVLKSLKNYNQLHAEGERLPGLPFTNEQMLFISFAQAWCEINTLQSLQAYLEDQHSPSKLRVWGTYRNLEAFSEVFNCPQGSPMNPAEKCNFFS